MTVSREQRSEILGKTDRLVRTRFFDPNFNGRNWPALVEQHRESIVNAGSAEEFELRMSALLKELGTSHTGFFRRESKVASRNSINATFRSRETAEGPRWIFQDVQPGGPAELAGIKAGDTLLSVDGHDVIPPIQPEFRMGSYSNDSRKKRNFQHTQVGTKFSCAHVAGLRIRALAVFRCRDSQLNVFSFGRTIPLNNCER